VHQIYLATWKSQGVTYRGRFCPADGEIKPDNEDVRGMIEQEKGLIMDVNNNGSPVV
jgi:hypothetical protein